MRLFAAMTIMLSLISTQLRAAEADAPPVPAMPAGGTASENNGPLAAGKPAGVAAAQRTDNILLWSALGLGAAGIILLATQGGSDSTSQTTTTTTGTH